MNLCDLIRLGPDGNLHRLRNFTYRVSLEQEVPPFAQAIPEEPVVRLPPRGSRRDQGSMQQMFVQGVDGVIMVVRWEAWQRHLERFPGLRWPAAVEWRAPELKSPTLSAQAEPAPLVDPAPDGC